MHFPVFKRRLAEESSSRLKELRQELPGPHTRSQPSAAEGAGEKCHDEACSTGTCTLNQGETISAALRRRPRVATLGTGTEALDATHGHDHG